MHYQTLQRTKWQQSLHSINSIVILVRIDLQIGHEMLFSLKRLQNNFISHTTLIVLNFLRPKAFDSLTNKMKILQAVKDKISLCSPFRLMLSSERGILSNNAPNLPLNQK